LVLAVLVLLPALKAGGSGEVVLPGHARPEPAVDDAPEVALAHFFSPGGGTRAAILDEIEHAREEILLAMYTFTSGDLAGALVRAKGRGVRVCVILDEGQRIREGSGANGRKSAYLVENGLEVWFDSVSGLMHNKFAVIDRRLVITGSYNWTEGAERRNFENLLIVRSASLAARYAAEFDEIKLRCAPALLFQRGLWLSVSRL